jgi:hypothetical protein
MLGKMKIIPLLITFIMTALYVSEAKCDCTAYYDFAIMKDGNGKLGIMDSSGNWILYGWNKMKHNKDIANWVDVEWSYKKRNQKYNCDDTVHDKGIIQVCYDDSEGKVITKWIQHYNWVDDCYIDRIINGKDPGGLR